ncbi:glycogen debranching N-terminal domain-containing protein [Methylocaldum szegediense]|uniref:Putative glycogen debranching enzyme N-terminal domain-containing protein n=1 Tax=Methylocaldum szegediense TaxID=73780 RepID=A0ABM9I0N8_9GAMM|nr:glycogen debranching N-terminal domain-containing protein [Methylocaldum szegediense]CAI8810502.1 protein of unknown function [Methylocaldum szegediense]
MTDTQRNNDQWYIAATTPRTQEVIRTLKHGDTFGVFDCQGDIGQTDTEEQGLYHHGTRFLSQWELLIDGGRPMLLGSIAREDNSLLIVDLTTPDIISRLMVRQYRFVPRPEMGWVSGVRAVRAGWHGSVGGDFHPKAEKSRCALVDRSGKSC